MQRSLTGFSMVNLYVRVPDELAARFDIAAMAAGGRSALLRRLMEDAAPASAPVAQPPRETLSDSHLWVRLGATEAEFVASEARRMGLPKATWVRALIRRRCGGPTFSEAGDLALDATRREMRRISVNLNQIVRAMTAQEQARALPVELATIEDLRRELRAHMCALGEAVAGNLAYWAPET